MNIAQFPKMIISSHEGWDQLEKTHPSAEKLFFSLVVPLSLLPPIMLYHAGPHFGDAFFPGLGGKPWNMIAVMFFLAEMVTYAGMGWLIKTIADTYKVEITLHDAYTLSALSPIPLWLSSLSLLAPSLAFNAGAALLALGISCAIIYHGVYAFCHMHEETVAASFTYTVAGAGLVAWAFLMLLVILPI